MSEDQMARISPYFPLSHVTDLSDTQELITDKGYDADCFRQTWFD
ncbi:hypothetical protein [Bartonella sp. HY406]|nr:hypothetical protein [Bartonella sp. HY406]UXN05127.1 hypothetical protein N6B01_15150 [Bartonella sp. HY406]